MQTIKNFIYLDEYKMYSISSQIFEGITEYLIDYQETKREEEEKQKGLIGSGKIMADILKSESGTEEKNISMTILISSLKIIFRNQTKFLVFR